MDRLIFDAAESASTLRTGTRWRFVADTVMGGVSSGSLRPNRVEGRDALVLEGEVRLDHGGGFIQASVDLGPGPVDASRFAGLELDLWGDGGPFVVSLKTRDLLRPWQSYRWRIEVPATWARYTLDFSEIGPHRTDAPFDPRHLTRLGLLALRRPGPARLAIGRVAWVGRDGGVREPSFVVDPATGQP